MKSSRISRVVRILTALQSGRGYTADGLANMFESAAERYFVISKNYRQSVFLIITIIRAAAILSILIFFFLL